MLRPSAVAASCLLLTACGSAPEGLRTVALVTIDTLRADYVHAYGFPQATTPQLDAIAARGVLFDRAIAASSSTIPSHASMMTGRYPRQQSTGARNGDTRLEDQATVADRFASAGWQTGAFVSNVVLQRRSGLDRGFAHYDERLPETEASRLTFERLADDAVDAALGWLREQDERPVFLWVHLQDPHGPYTPPPEWLERVDAPQLASDPELAPAKIDRPSGAIPRYQYIEGVHRASEYARRYAAEIAYTDAALGRLVAGLSARDGELALLVTSDHGESLGENDRYLQHGHASTPELARVPLLLVAPGLAAGRRGELVSHVDVAPTLLDLAGLEPLPDAAGLALSAALREGRTLPERTLFCDAVGESSAYRLRSYVRLAGFADSTAARAIERLDAGENTGLIVRGSAQGADGTWGAGVDPQLVRDLRSYLRSEVSVKPASLEPATLERLRKLGYLGDEDPG
jgi:arylsulfatase A-like enzyme